MAAADFGRRVLGKAGTSLSVLANSENVRRKVGGTVIDWATVAAVSGSAVTLADGVVADVGSKYLRYGQVLCKITASGEYGPYDPAAADGRELLNRGDCYVLEQTVVNDDPQASTPPVLYGGDLFKARVLATSGAASLAAGPTWTNFNAAFPQVQLVS